MTIFIGISSLYYDILYLIDQCDRRGACALPHVINVVFNSVYIRV